MPDVAIRLEHYGVLFRAEEVSLKRLEELRGTTRIFAVQDEKGRIRAAVSYGELRVSQASTTLQEVLMAAARHPGETLVDTVLNILERTEKANPFK